MSLKIYVKYEHQNVTLVENKVFVDIKKDLEMKSSWI